MRVISALLFVILMCASAPTRAEDAPAEVQGLPAGQVLVVIEDRLIYFSPKDRPNKVYTIPIAVGKPGMQSGIIGTWKITRMEKWPTWTPTKNMIARKPKLARWANGMPGGPKNPLGARALYLGHSLYRLHGTNEPSSIGRAASSGCIRMLNEDVVWLYDRVRTGTKVTVVRRLEDYGGPGAMVEDADEEVDVAISVDEDVDDTDFDRLY